MIIDSLDFASNIVLAISLVKYEYDFDVSFPAWNAFVHLMYIIAKVKVTLNNGGNLILHVAVQIDKLSVFLQKAIVIYYVS